MEKIRRRLINENGDVVNPAKEETLSQLDSDLNAKIPQPFAFDSNGNVLVYMGNPTIAYDSTNDWLKIDVKNDDVGLAKDSTLQQALPRNITEISGTALTGRDWSGDLSKLQNVDTQLSTRASESTLSQIDTDLNTKIPQPFTFDSNGNLIVNTQLTEMKIEDSSGTVINPAKDETVQALKPKDDHFVAEIDVGTTAVQVNTDTLIRDEITIYADKNNTDIVMLGNSDSNLVFPLNAGDTVTIKKSSLSKVWFIANSGTQKVYVDAGGGW